MKRYLLLFTLSFFTMVLSVSADKRDPRTITFEECKDGFVRPYVITVNGNALSITIINDRVKDEPLIVYDFSYGNIVLSEKITASSTMEVNVTLKKGIYLVVYDKKHQKVKIGH